MTESSLSSSHTKLEGALEPLRIYSRDLLRYPKLSEEETDALVRRMQSGDAQAKEELLLHHLWVIVLTAKKYWNANVPVEDLIQNASIRLSEHITEYDPERGSFRLFAWLHARSSILNNIRFERHRTENGLSFDHIVSQGEEVPVVSPFLALGDPADLALRMDDALQALMQWLVRFDRVLTGLGQKHTYIFREYYGLVAGFQRKDAAELASMHGLVPTQVHKRVRMVWDHLGKKGYPRPENTEKLELAVLATEYLLHFHEFMADRTRS
jgi:RNA polymerase sigma factor (sigma-70 family)